jgi:hypothetical protein
MGYPKCAIAFQLAFVALLLWGAYKEYQFNKKNF